MKIQKNNLYKFNFEIIDNSDFRNHETKLGVLPSVRDDLIS